MKKLYWVGLLLILGCAVTNPYLWRLPKETQQIYYTLEPVATDEELKEFLRLDPKEREQWLKVFWKKRDPTPTTEKNEFKKEHQRRVEYAKENFRSTFGKRPWDDRGEVYIKYGEPDEKGKPFKPSPGFILDQEEEWRKANTEIWRYFRYDLTFQFYDGDNLGDYDLSPPIDDEKPSRTETELLSLFAVTRSKKVEIQKEIYLHDYGGEVLEYALDVIKFRSKGKTYDLDVNVGLPLDKLGLGGDESNLVSFMQRIVIWDEDADQVAFDSITLTKSVDKNERKGYLLVDQRTYNLDPGQYTLAVEVRDLYTQKIGIYKKDFLIPEYFFPDSQEISEVVMASFIRPVLEREEKFVKHDLLVMPLPSKVYFTTQTISFYYEIYNLKKDQRGKSRYYVSYSLIDFKHKKERPIYLSNVFEADTTDVFQVGTLDPSQIGPGEYALAILVKDLNSENEKVSLTSFKIVK